MHPSAASANIGSKSLAAVAISIAVLFGALAVWGADKRILGLFHDDAIYAVVGKAIAEGEGYRIVSLPGAPAQTKYPFAYSYLLSWLWAIDPEFPQNISLLKFFNGAVLLAIFLVAVLFYRRYASGVTIASLLFAVLVCSNPIIFGFTDYVLSDLLLVLLTLCALSICGAAEGDQMGSFRWLLLTVIVGLACLNRTAALPLVIAGAVHLFVMRGWRSASYFLFGVLLMTAPWLGWEWFHAPRQTESLFAYYIAYDATGAGAYSGAPALANHWSIIRGNANYLFDMMELFYLTPLLPGVGYLLAFVSFIGVISTARKATIFAWTFFLSSIALLLVWPFHPGRYLAPLAPLLLLPLFRGMSEVQSRLQTALQAKPRWQWLSRLGWSPLLLVLLLNGVWLSGFLLIRDEQSTRGLYGRRLPFGWSGFEESFAWVRKHTEPNALLATAYDPMYYLYTGRRAIRPALHRPATYFYPYGEAQPNVGSVEEIKPQLAKLGVKYFIVDPLDGYAEGKVSIALFDQIIHSFGHRAEKVFSSADGKHRIYRLVFD
jgi:hypothetical protein